MLIRTKYAKLKPLRYISHLELMNVLRRAFRRAEIPTAFTGGFNPHVKLSLSQPLSVGMTGCSEYFDLELAEEMPPKIFREKLSVFLPAGLELLETREVSAATKSLQAVADTAIYRITMNIDDGLDEERIIKDFMSLPEIKVTRERRNKKDRVIDLKPMIHNIEIIDQAVWDFTVSTGSRGNVRTEELLRALAERFEGIKEVPEVNIERRGLYKRINDELYQPFAKKVTGS